MFNELNLQTEKEKGNHSKVSIRLTGITCSVPLRTSLVHPTVKRKWRKEWFAGKPLQLQKVDFGSLIGKFFTIYFHHENVVFRNIDKFTALRHVKYSCSMHKKLCAFS